MFLQSLDLSRNVHNEPPPLILKWIQNNVKGVFFNLKSYFLCEWAYKCGALTLQGYTAPNIT